MTSYLEISRRVAFRREPVTLPPVLPSQTRVRTLWDDEISDPYHNICRTQDPEWTGVAAPPAVLRFAPYALAAGQGIGEYWVDIPEYHGPFQALNEDWDDRIFEWWSWVQRAQFNKNGWPRMQYLVFSGNELRGEFIGDWFRFETLTPADAGSVAGMTAASHPWLVHSFNCVSFRDGQTRHIESTNTNHGRVYFHVVTVDGEGWIPAR